MGATGALVGLFLMWMSKIANSFALFSFSWFVTSISLNMSSSPFQAIIPDIVNQSQMGLASGS
jgi:MFS-type transporter involved in bile tolerance (Atg22 family)